MNLKDAYLHGTDLGALVKNISWSNGKLVIKWALEGKADTTLDTPVSGANITLSTSALNFLTANNTTYTIQLPSTDPYQSDNDSRYLKLAGGTMTGHITMAGQALYFGQSGTSAILSFNSSYPKYGIWYCDDNVDKMMFSASGNGDSVSGADLCINGNGDGTVTIRGNSIWHAGNLSPMTTSHAANGITSTNISNWNSAYNWYNLTVATESDTDAIINKWKEVTDFLNGITDTETLTSLLAGRVAKSGDTMTGALTTPGLTVTGAATFSQAINGSILGNAATASRLQNARNIAISGAVTGNANFDGSGNITISTSVNHTHSYLPLAGGQMTGHLTWSGNAALPQLTSPQYFLVIDAFDSGGTTKWSDILSTLKALGIKDSSGNNVYLPLTGGTLTNTGYILTVNNSGGGDSGIKIQRGANTAWGILVSSGNFYLKELTTNTNFLTINEVSHGSLATFAGLVKSTGFVKTTSSDSYVLLGGGGHKPISEFTTLSGEQTITGNKTFTGSVSIDDLTAGNLVVTGGASFAQTINGNAATASKLATARTISLTGSVTGSGTFDGSGNLSIATTTNHTHDYLPLAGGTMTGATPINFTPNTVQMNFRPGHDGYNAKLEYMTNGNEALVFATKNAVTSFMFVNGLDLTDRSDYAAIGATTTNKIAMQIKSNKVTINKAIRGDSDSQTAALDVGGTVLSEKLGYSGLIYNTDYRFIHDSASFIKQNSSTGTICIKLPLLFNSTNGLYDMPVIKLVIYEYSTQGASEIIIGGHNWNGSWYNCTYTVTGNYNKGVRLGRLTDGDKNYCILLGTIDTTWNYVAVYVTDTFTQYSNDWIANWINACTVSQITDESNIAGIVNPGYGIGSKYLPLAGGTITGSLTIDVNTTYPLTLKGNSSYSVIHFLNRSSEVTTDIGWLNDDRGNMTYIANLSSTSVISTDASNPYWSDNTSNFKKYIIIHSGNYTDYLYNQSTSDSRFVLKAGDTMTGALTVPSLSVTGAATFSQAINGSILGNAATASRLLNARNIAISGAVTGNANFDGSGNITISTSVNHTHNYAGSGSVGGAATNVVVNDSNADSTYRMVWHSGNTLYSTDNIYCNPSTDTFYSKAISIVADASANASTDATAYIKAYSNNDWGMIIDKSTSYTYGLYIRAGGTYALKVDGSSRFASYLKVGADAAPSCALDVTGVINVTNLGNTLSIGSLNTSWCHFQNSVNIPFYFNKSINVDGELVIYGTSYKINNTTSVLNDLRVSGDDLYIGSASGSQCHQLYDANTHTLRFYFD